MRIIASHAIVAVAAVLLVVGALASAGPAVSQEGAGDDAGKSAVDLRYTPPSPEELQAQMQRWQQTMTPSKYHRLFERMIGEWTTETSIYMSQDAPPMQSTGTASFAWRVPGKWLAYEDTGSMMNMPVSRWGFLGYDNFKHKYISAWHDSLSTNMLVAEGTLDMSGNTLMMWGPMDEPMTGQTGKTVRYDYRFVDDDTIIFEVHDLHIGGARTRVVEVVYRRKQ